MPNNFDIHTKLRGRVVIKIKSMNASMQGGARCAWAAQDAKPSYRGTEKMPRGVISRHTEKRARRVISRHTEKRGARSDKEKRGATSDQQKHREEGRNE